MKGPPYTCKMAFCGRLASKTQEGQENVADGQGVLLSRRSWGSRNPSHQHSGDTVAT